MTLLETLSRPRYRVRCVIIVLVKLSALVAQINDLHFLKQRTKTLTKVTFAC